MNSYTEISYEDLEKIVGYFASSENLELLIVASRLYASEFNEFDEVLEVARKAFGLFPSKRTRKNYQEMARIRNYTIVD